MTKLYKETLDFFDGDKIRARVFLDKYALRDRRDNVLEKTPKEMWKRVANAIEIECVLPALFLEGGAKRQTISFLN